MNGNESRRTVSGSSAATAQARQRVQAPVDFGEDFHLTELLRTLRSLAADSPERQAKLEGLMRAYATGSLHVDAEATADAMIDDALVGVRH